jgi:hypothetical protein
MNKQLNKAYEKRLKALNKDFFKDNKTGLFLYIEYLKYLRDNFILEPYKDDRDKLKVAALSAAIAEFYAYNESSVEDTKRFHWNNFCELMRLNMEEWLVSNDSV